MKRVARIVLLVAAGVLFTAVTHTYAQAPAATDQSRFFVAVDAGGSFGHTAGGVFGGEAGFNVGRGLAIVLEGGRMTKVGSDDLDTRAAKIGNAVKATASAQYKVNFGDVGLRYSPAMSGLPVHPYIGVGFGLAEVRAETTLSVNGTTVTPESLGVQFGNDLNGAVKKPFVMVGGGVTMPIGTSYFVDGSLRYGRILPKTAETENDTGVNTIRAVVGVGVRF